MIFANSPQSRAASTVWGTFLRERGDQRFLATVSCYTAYDMSAKRTTRILAVSVPPGTARDFERTARDEGRNKSELFREMLRVYRAYRETRTFESLQRYGAVRARRLGIRDESAVER